MYVDKQYRRGSANSLMSYIDRTERPIRDFSGMEMSDEEIQKFIDTSEEYEYEESWIYSPERGDELSAEEISLAVRKTMREHMDDRQRTTYCYAVHTDDENHHAHIAATGASSAMWTDVDDLDRMRALGAEHTREVERDRNRTQERDRERDRQQSRDRRAADDRRARDARDSEQDCEDRQQDRDDREDRQQDRDDDRQQERDR